MLRNTTTGGTNNRFRNGETDEGSDLRDQPARSPVSVCDAVYQALSFRPTHQITPTVAVCCSLLRTPSVLVKKDGWFEKSLRHS
jgi:hypothetical protein